VARQSGSSRISLSVITMCSCRASGISARRLHTLAFGIGDAPATIRRAGTSGKSAIKRRAIATAGSVASCTESKTSNDGYACANTLRRFASVLSSAPASGRSTETGSKKPARLTPLCRYRHTATRAIAQYTSDPVSSASNGAM